MNTAYTPGPWHVEPQQDGYSWEICTSSPGAWLMFLRSTREATSDERSEDFANARLMAAAPELLDALQKAHHTIDCLMAKCIAMDPDFMPTKSRHWPAILAVSSAIAKATGEQA